MYVVSWNCVGRRAPLTLRFCGRPVLLDAWSTRRGCSALVGRGRGTVGGGGFLRPARGSP